MMDSWAWRCPKQRATVFLTSYFSTMLQELKNMEGVAVLSKEQQGAIQGGGSCTLFYSNPDGSSYEERVNFGSQINGSAASNAASQRCASSMSNEGWGRCQYDCDYDNPGGTPRSYLSE